MSLDDLNVEEIEARCEAATPGPWRISRLRDGGDLVMQATDDAARNPIGVVVDCSDPYGFNGDPDAAFIAAAREDVPALIAEIRKLRMERDAFR